MSRHDVGGYVPPEGQRDTTAKAQSELSSDEKRRVANFEPDDDQMERARAILTDASNEIGLDTPDDAVIEQVAKIIGALGEENIPRAVDGGLQKLWLLTEGYINTGKDPSPINEAALSAILPGNPEALTDTPEAIRKRIDELEAEAIMPMPQKPEDGASPEEVKEYRKQLVMRHLKATLGKRYGVYSAGNMESLGEVMLYIADSKHPDFDKLLEDVRQKLKDAGAQVESLLTVPTEKDLGEIADMIAESEVPIHEKTSKEKYLHDQGLEKYVAQDLTTRYEIYDLRQQLRR